ncbi:MAG: DNA-binding protein, partial [Prevotella sp.]|nr:DNA-binding protein [Prevotella sp.]
VKIDDLAIFSVGLKNTVGGASSPEEFTASANISSVKLRARATGILRSSALNMDATLKKVSASPQPTAEGGV